MMDQKGGGGQKLNSVKNILTSPNIDRPYLDTQNVGPTLLRKTKNHRLTHIIVIFGGEPTKYQ